MAAVQRFSRDNARTPVQWTDAENAGFTTGTPWLPVNDDYRTFNAASEELGMTEDELDDHEDLYTAFMVLCQDMYDNRAMYVDKNNVNRVVDSILFRHRTNFV